MSEIDKVAPKIKPFAERVFRDKLRRVDPSELAYTHAERGLASSMLCAEADKTPELQMLDFRRNCLRVVARHSFRIAPFLAKDLKEAAGDILSIPPPQLDLLARAFVERDEHFPEGTPNFKVVIAQRELAQRIMNRAEAGLPASEQELRFSRDLAYVSSTFGQEIAARVLPQR